MLVVTLLTVNLSPYWGIGVYRVIIVLIVTMEPSTVGGVELRHCDYISTVLYTSNLILFLIHNHPPHHPTIPSMTMTAHGNDDHLATQTR